MKKILGGIANPWNALQSALTEQPFEVYALSRSQVSMLYHTMKDHLIRHVEVLTTRPTGSIWDYIPEPRLHDAQPPNNDAQPGDADFVNPEDMVERDPEGRIRCHGCGRFMHRDDVYPCMDCHMSPFHLECLEPHYDQCPARPQRAHKEKEKAEEKEILQEEAEDARSQWAYQMAKLSEITMPLSRKIASIAIALVSVALAVDPFWSPATANTPVSLLK